MGGAVSSGQSNDDLINNLLDADYIKTPAIERAFRAVDRGEYFIYNQRIPHVNAYKDLAWRNGNFHISAPCIYSEVLEGLDLEPGLSFLNLGSGTGYLSTVVGLILGSNGVNHGVEIHEEVVTYANQKLEDFKMHSGAIDEYDFCEPKFIQGNCLCLATGSRLYDRVYCGAACPEQHLNYMKNLIKIGGILIIPVNEQLLEIQRTSETHWDSKSLLPVSFANLITVSTTNQEPVHLLDIEPLSLQELCRSSIRNILRKLIQIETPTTASTTTTTTNTTTNYNKDGGTTKKTKTHNRKRRFRPYFDSLVDSNDSSSDENNHKTTNNTNKRSGSKLKHEPIKCCHESMEFYDFINRMSNAYVPNTIPYNNNNHHRSISSSNNNNNNRQSDDNNENINRNETTSGNSDNETLTVNERLLVEERLRHIVDGIFDGNVANLQSFNEDDDDDDDEEEQESVSSNEDDLNNKKLIKINTLVLDEAGASSNNNKKLNNKKKTTNTTNNREKVDSGLGDEIVEAPELSDNDNDDEDDVDDDFNLTLESSSDNTSSNSSSSSSSDDDDDNNDRKQDEKRTKRNRKKSNSKLPRIDKSTDSDDKDYEMKMYKSPFSMHMKNKIQQLPLPVILKNYLNFYRDINLYDTLVANLQNEYSVGEMYENNFICLLYPPNAFTYKSNKNLSSESTHTHV